MTDDAQLLRIHAEEKSEAAFAELVRRHLDLVYSAALRQVGGDAHRAHDVAQTVFIALSRKADAVARHPVLVGWLYTSTQHAAAKVRRSEARRRAREHEAQLMSEVEARDSVAVEREKLSPLLDEAMGELNERDREAVLLRRERTAAGAKAAALAAQLRESEASVRSAAERVAGLEGQLAAAKKTVVGAPANAAPAAPRASVSSVPRNSPGYARAYVEKYRAGLGLRYGPLYRALGLSPEQIAKFEATLTEGQQGVVDVWAEASKQGLPMGGNSASSTSVARMTSGPLGIMENGLKELLGEAGFEKYKQFDKARGSRELITSLAGGLYSSAAPLTPAQGESLAAALANNTRTERMPMTDDGKNTLYRISEVTDWAGVQMQAQGFLSTQQLAALKVLSDQKQLDQEMEKITRAAASAAAAKPVIGGGK